MNGTGRKKSKCLILACAAFLLFSASFYIRADAAAPVYTVEFRAGNHGSFGGETKVSVSKSYKETLTAIPEPDLIDSGYWFTGYDKAVETTVTESVVYVAQYARLIHAVEYRIHYVNPDGAALATPRVAYANEGETIRAYAPAVSGYTPDAPEKSILAQAEGTTITFIYTPVGTVNPVNPGDADNADGNAGDGAANAADGGEDGNLQEIGDEEVPQGSQQLENGGLTEIADEEVPLANLKGSRQRMQKWGTIAAAVATAAAGGGFVLIRKRRKKQAGQD